jgi:hypothetical protein
LDIERMFRCICQRNLVKRLISSRRLIFIEPWDIL